MAFLDLSPSFAPTRILRHIRLMPRVNMARIWQVAKERQTLQQLDAHLLKDVGLTANQAQHEAHRAPWDLP